MRSANRSDLRCPAQKSPYHTKGRDKKKKLPLLQVFLELAFPRRGSLFLDNLLKSPPPILSTACNLSGLGEKPVASVVWR